MRSFIFSLSEKILRTILIYLFLVVALASSVSGNSARRTLSTCSSLLLVANAVQNGIIGNDVSVTGAIVGALVLFGLNTAFARGIFRFPWMAIPAGRCAEPVDRGGQTEPEGPASRVHLVARPS
jgi:hypothetical protein